MLIRINLLAEQQWQEEMRRRDPVKKAIYIAGMLVGLMFVLIVMLGLGQAAKSSKLEKAKKAFDGTTNDFVNASNQLRNLSVLQGTKDSLYRYATNRYLWADALDALPQAIVTNVQYVRLLSTQIYQTNQQITVQTNITRPLPPGKPWWKFFGKAPVHESMLPGITNEMNSIARRPAFLVNYFPAVQNYGMKTNKLKPEVTFSLAVTRPMTTSEFRYLEITGKDYSPQAGQGIFGPSGLTNAILTSPYFGRYLTPTNLVIETTLLFEQEPLNPTKQYVSFKLRLVYPEIVRSNE